MDHRLIISTLFLLAIGQVGNAYGYGGIEWVAYRSGHKIPENAVLVESQEVIYVGRARHFDEILPAQIYPNGSAFISSCDKIIPKVHFEILTTSDKCEWKDFSEISQIDETIVRVGSAWNNEPIFVGASINGLSYSGNNYQIASIYLTKNLLNKWQSQEYYANGPQWKYLSCNTKNEWIDSGTFVLPNNTVSGGRYEYEIYVARLKRDCEVVTGQVIPDIGTATAILNNGDAIDTFYCQVLVGEPNEYIWVEVSNGQIPDYAVVNGKQGNELAFIARVNKSITHLTYSEALRNSEYDILVKNT